MQNVSDIKYWSLSSEEALASLESSKSGLAETESTGRLKLFGENSIKSKSKTAPLLLLLNQFKNPIMIILIVATVISGLTGDLTDSLIIMAIVLASVALSFYQEYSANNVVEELRSRIQLQSSVLREGKPVEISTRLIVPGDIIVLSAGSLIPADGLILECDDFFVNQSILTGEALPVEKKPVPVPETSSLAERDNCVFTGTNVYSGTAKKQNQHQHCFIHPLV
jgi:Mg2+-importing ATPase